MTMIMVETLNGNYILKSPEKVRATDMVEMEFYGETMADIMAQFKAHKKELR